MNWENILLFGRGPLFTASFVFLVLGLARIALLQAVELTRAWRRAGGAGLSMSKRLEVFAVWAWRASPVLGFRGPVIFISFVFYALTILAALFLIDHILLWHSGTGLWWRGLSKPAADLFACLAMVSGATLLLLRFFHAPTRGLSDLSDFVIVPLLLVTLGAGLLAAHPQLSLASYTAVMSAHVLSADLVFFLFPFSRVARELLHPVRGLDPSVFHELAESASRPGRGTSREGAGAEARRGE
jgi:hypothetical protein